MIGNIIILTTAVFGVAQQSVSPSSLGMVLSLTVKVNSREEGHTKARIGLSDKFKTRG